MVKVPSIALFNVLSVFEGQFLEKCPDVSSSVCFTNCVPRGFSCDIRPDRNEVWTFHHLVGSRLHNLKHKTGSGPQPPLLGWASPITTPTKKRCFTRERYLFICLAWWRTVQKGDWSGFKQCNITWDENWDAICCTIYKSNHKSH